MRLTEPATITTPNTSGALVEPAEQQPHDEVPQAAGQALVEMVGTPDARAERGGARVRPTELAAPVQQVANKHDFFQGGVPACRQDEDGTTPPHVRQRRRNDRHTEAGGSRGQVGHQAQPADRGRDAEPERHGFPQRSLRSPMAARGSPERRVRCAASSTGSINHHGSQRTNVMPSRLALGPSFVFDASAHFRYPSAAIQGAW